MKIKIIGGILGGRFIQTPVSVSRPTTSRVRESFFNINQSLVDGIDFLDLFAGSGAMGIEAISRGAKSAVFVEKDRKASQCIQTSINSLGIDHACKVYCFDILKGLKRLDGHSFDIIYIDPPYKFYEKMDIIVELLEEIANLKLLKQEGHLFLEAPYEISVNLEEYKIIKVRKYGNSILHTLAYQ